MAIITISRGTFTGGQKLAECVAEKLGYRCISREVVVDAAREYGVGEDKLYKALTGSPGLLERLTLERTHYIACIRAALCKAVKDDRVVYHGYAGHLLLRGVPHVLRVRVIANVEQRIKAAMDRNGVKREDIIEIIEKTDRERARWTKFLYHVDWHDPTLYDIVVDLEHISLSGACDIVVAATNMEEFKATPEALRIMDDLVLGTDVRARIAADASIGDAEVNVEANGGIVTVSGTVGSLEEIDRIKKIVRQMPGSPEFRSKLHVQTHWAMVQGRYLR